VLLPHAGGHRNYNVAALATEKKCSALFFLLRCAGTVAKEATYAVTGGNLGYGSMIWDWIIKYHGMAFLYYFIN
jgi:hypothetical protein